MKNKFSSLLRGRILPLLRRTFLHNWGTKLISFVFAIVLWNYAVLTLETTRNVILTDVPLTVTNASVLRQKGLALSRPIADTVGPVRVVIATSLSGAGSVSPDLVSVTCDLSGIATAGTHVVNLVGRSIHGQIAEVSPSSITLDVEALATKELPIHVKTTGSTVRSSYAGTATLSVERVTLTGPSALLATIREAQVVVPLNSASQDFENSYPIELINAEGEVVTSSLISLSQDTTIVRVPIIHTRELEIDPNACLIGSDQLQEGYKIASVEVYPKTLQVEGTAKAIKALETSGLTLSQIDLTGASSDVRTYPNVYLPGGASLTQPQSILVIVRIEREMKTVVLSDVPVEIRNVHTDLRGSLSASSIDLTLVGPADRMDSIPEKHIEVYVDAQNRSAGVFIAPVHVLIDASYEATVTPSQTDLTVTLQKIQPQE